VLELMAEGAARTVAAPRLGRPLGWLGVGAGILALLLGWLLGGAAILLGGLSLIPI